MIGQWRRPQTGKEHIHSREGATEARIGHRRFTDDGYRDPAAKYHEPAAQNDQPLPAIYFEPTSNVQPPAANQWWRVVGHGTTESRGIQNVPSTATVGVQYVIDQTGSRVPAYTLAPGVGIPSLQNPGGVQEVGSVGGPRFYCPPSPPYGPQPVAAVSGTTPVVGGVVSGQPLVVSGSSCPLCGRQDYHVHSDAVVVNSTNNAVTGPAAAANIASSGIVPVPQVAVTSVQPTFLPRSVHFTPSLTRPTLHFAC